MRTLRTIAVSCLLAPTLGAATFASTARALSLEERIAAERALLKVDYSHEIGATAPFETAVPESVVAERVADALRKSVALERFWKTPVTGEMLRGEVERMARRTRWPDRLAEKFAALGNDAFLLQECLARPALVDRLVRSFYASDETIHAAGTGERGEGSWDSWWAGHRVEFDPAEARAVGDAEATLPTPGGSRDPSVASTDSACPDDTWINAGLDDVPDPRTGPTIVWTGSRAIVWGGYTGDIPVATGGRYDPATDTWEPTDTTSAPEGRYFHSAVWTGTRMIVWGGRTDQAGTLTDTGARYDPVANTWTAISRTNAPSARRGHTAVWTGSRMVVWGSYNEIVPGGGRYDPATDTWAPVTSANAPTERHGHTAVWTGTRMIVWGGVDNIFPGTLQNTGGSYDPAGDAWTATTTTAAPAARRDHTAVWTGSRMVVWGGSIGDNSVRTGGQYNPSMNSWSATSTTNAPTARSGHTAVWNGSVMIVWAGNGPSAMVRSGGRYSPGTNTWAATTLTGVPSGRASHAAIWTGSAMVVWGGQDSVGSVNTGGRYDPTGDSWTPTSTGPAPETRKDHTAVWTGSRMIVWGGSHGFQYLDTGGIYDPATDVWTATSMTGAPAARVLHTATWGAGRMIVWGGVGTAFFNDGGRFDPVANAWTPTSLVGAPAPRRAHSAVWTGQHLVVWGGTNVDPGSGQLVPLDTGGRYDPGNDSWAPTASAGAPTPRRGHASAWTGSSVFIWGGDGGNAAPFLGDGAFYDPTGDAWTPVASAGAPSARQEMTAVAVGGKIVVWGGFNLTSQALVDGARFDPSANSWSALSSAGAPEGRRFASVLSTGNEMILWGGWMDGVDNGPDIFFGTGGRYDLQGDAWRPTSAASIAARRDHTAVWAGDRMLLWGGTNGSFGPLGSGGGYCACLQAVWHADADGDGFGDPLVTTVACGPPAGHVLDGSDCNDGAAGVWATPGEATSLVFTNATTLSWDAPDDPGATTVQFDVLRAANPSDFVGSTVCIATSQSGTTVQDAGVPAAGARFSYLVRARNGCPGGVGSGPLGRRSDGMPRIGRVCP